MEPIVQPSQPLILQCFTALYNPHSTSQLRKQADTQLMDMESNPIALLAVLFAIFEENPDPNVKLQALVYACNVLKRNWTLRRYSKEHSGFNAAKKEVRVKLLYYLLQTKERRYLVTLFDMARFIAKADFPHYFPDFAQLVIRLLKNVDLSDYSVLIFKELREIFNEIGERKGTFSRKQFEDHIWEMMQSIGTLAANFKSHLEQQLQSQQQLNRNAVKLSKYSDQMLLAILRVTPIQIMDTQFAPGLMKLLLQKLQFLLTAHRELPNNSKALLQKNIKSLIYGLGLVQVSKPLILAWIIQDFYNILRYVIGNYALFAKSATTRYSLIGIKRIIRQFPYYADQNLYSSSVKHKNLSSNHRDLRNICVNFYASNINESTVQDLLKYLIITPMGAGAREEHCLVEPDDEQSVQKGREKELSLQGCVIGLIESLLERFPQLTQNMVKRMLSGLMQNNWDGIEWPALNTLFSVLAILPTTCKKNQLNNLRDVPVLQILQFIHSQPTLRLKFAAVVSGWLPAFTDEQTNQLTAVLLDFIEAQASKQDLEQVDTLMACCECLNKVIKTRANVVNLGLTIQRVVPVALQVLQTVDNPQVLWPMVTLVSNIILKVEFNSELIVRAIDSNKLALLVANRSPVLVEALCDMFKGFLCVIPRNMPAQSVYEVICFFLNNHLGDLSNPNYEKIFHLWYIAIREYSPNQRCDNLYSELFHTHFRKNLHRKTGTLVYILEEYMLSGLLPDEPAQFVSMVIECYLEADELTKEEQEKLKIAALSFQITLITRYTLEQTNSNRMLQLILRDLCRADDVGSTVRNSLLSIVNRYLILHRDAFFAHLIQIGLQVDVFLQGYFASMNHLTSHASAKINAVALMSLITYLDPVIVRPQINPFLRLIIPQVENYIQTVQTGGNNQTFVGRVEDSPTSRFASNTLSERKLEVRRKDTFESMNLLQLFRESVGGCAARLGVQVAELATALGEQVWYDRMMKLL